MDGIPEVSLRSTSGYWMSSLWDVGWGERPTAADMGYGIWDMEDGGGDMRNVKL